MTKHKEGTPLLKVVYGKLFNGKLAMRNKYALMDASTMRLSEIVQP
jgi:hypothetical protein